MRAILLAVLLASPASADPVSGLDDPAFRAPFDRALQGDDPTALAELHAAAEAGNQAAILALPVVSSWLQTTVPFAERKKLARVNGVPMAEAFLAADPVAALWAMGEPGSDMDALLSRSFALYDAGEPDKATLLFMTWINQTGGYGPLPPRFFDHPVPPWAMAHLLRGRLIDNGITLPADGDALLVDRLKADDPAAWIALAAFAGLHDPTVSKADSARVGAIINAAGVSDFYAVGSLAEAITILWSFDRNRPIPDLDMDTAELAAAATEVFGADPEFQPLLTLCASACPATADQCNIAYIAAFGHPYGRATMTQPLTSLISTEDFFATPRGQLILLRSTAGQLGDDPSNSLALKAARDIDACLADAVLAAVP